MVSIDRNHDNHIKRQEDFLHDIRMQSFDKNIEIDLGAIELALRYAVRYHGDQVRHSGELYYYHPMDVALIASKLHFTTEVIISSLLHDTVEDTNLNIDQILFIFGTKVADLVIKLTKLDDDMIRKIKLSEEDNLLRLLGTEDLDACYIKLADRLHNMRTIHHIKSQEKRRRIAMDTLKTFVPLAKHAKVKWIEEEIYNIASNITEGLSIWLQVATKGSVTRGKRSSELSFVNDAMFVVRAER